MRRAYEKGFRRTAVTADGHDSTNRAEVRVNTWLSELVSELALEACTSSAVRAAHCGSAPVAAATTATRQGDSCSGGMRAHNLFIEQEPAVMRMHLLEVHTQVACSTRTRRQRQGALPGVTLTECELTQLTRVTHCPHQAARCKQ
jgi:hypothetical protein